MQIEIQNQIAADLEKYTTGIFEYLSRKNDNWAMKINPTYNPAIGDSKIAVFQTEFLAIVIYINTRGRLTIEPIIEIDNTADFGIGYRVSDPISAMWDRDPKGIVIAIKRRLNQWKLDVSKFIERQRQLNDNLQIALEYKVSFARELGIDLDNADATDRLTLPDIGEVLFTNKGVKLGQYFTPIDWQVAAQIVIIISTHIQENERTNVRTETT